jgi:hypothetical protein
VIETSVDGSTWNEIDRQKNVESLNGSDRIQIFEVRFVRIQQTETTSVAPRHRI